MDDTKTHIEEWYIIFTATTLKHWIFRFIDSELQHCYAVKESEGGEFWIVLDSKNAFTQVKLVAKSIHPHIRSMSPDGVVLKVRAKINPSLNRHTLCILNCVELVKSVLGIKAFWCWTPKQLYKRLACQQT